MAALKQRIDGQAAFILHTVPYRETSLILEVFSCHYGRVSMVARGARRPQSSLRGVLMAFQPVELAWFGASELKTLHKAEWVGGVPQLSGLALMCGFYLNELLLRLLAKEDAHPALFGHYFTAVSELAAHGPVEPILRRFELALLAELGYGLDLKRDAASQPIAAELRYRYVPQAGLQAHPLGSLAGSSLINMAADKWQDALTLQQSKLLMRTMLSALLGEQPLHTRQLLIDLQKI